MTREEVETLMAVRRLVEDRIEKLSFELEISKHALERLKTLHMFYETMSNKATNP